MALIRCTDCGKSISENATSCVGCGCPVSIIKRNTSKNQERRDNEAAAYTLKLSQAKPFVPRYTNCSICRQSFKQTKENTQDALICSSCNSKKVKCVHCGVSFNSKLLFSAVYPTYSEVCSDCTSRYSHS